MTTETPTTAATGTDSSMRHFLVACGTFASNIVERFHEYADARLADELTIVEQRRRLLNGDEGHPASGHRQALTPRTAHLD